MIDALDGEPGVTVGPISLDPTRRTRNDSPRSSSGLHGLPDRPRTARFVCALAVADGDRIVFETIGTVEGTIASRRSGVRGFGYDPIFYYPLYRPTLAEVDEDEKLAIAHRGQAFRALAEWIRRKQ